MCVQSTGDGPHGHAIGAVGSLVDTGPYYTGSRSLFVQYEIESQTEEMMLPARHSAMTGGPLYSRLVEDSNEGGGARGGALLGAVELL